MSLYRQMQKSEDPCPLCESTDAEELATRDRYQMGVRTVGCGDCGFVYTNPRPTAAALDHFYKNDYRRTYGHEEQPTLAAIEHLGLRERARHAADAMQRLGVLPAKSFLELGCGHGCLLEEVKRRNPGCLVRGVEPSAAYAAFSAKLAGCEVTAEHQESTEPVEVIAAVHVLEHVRDPVDFLRQLASRLSASGRIYLCVPDASRHSELRDLHLAHLNHFSLETLLRAAKKAGLVALAAECHDPPRNVVSLHVVLRRGDGREVSKAVRRLGRSLLAPASSAEPAPRRLRIRSVADWLRDQPQGLPWLLLGKGPSFGRLSEVDTSAYRLLGLNHVCRETRVDVAHAIDLDVITDLGEALLQQAGVLVMPWHPHVEFKATERTLADFALEYPVLETLAAEGRLLTYTFGTGSSQFPGAPTIPGGFFSGDVVVQLLGLCGIRRIRTLGIDGGHAYAGAFSDVRPLQNGQESFDVQTTQIAHVVKALGLDYAPVLPLRRLTIVLVVLDELKALAQLVRALRAFTRQPYELIVVDNASNTETRDYLCALATEPNVRLIRNEENRQCAAATNQAIAACQTEFVVYLCARHAVVTEPGWDEDLVGFMEKHPQFGIAGDVWNPRYTLSSSRYAGTWTPEGHGLEKLLHVQGGAWIARRALFEEVGLFAEDEHPHGGMDVEFSFRLLSLGKTLGHCTAILCPSAPELPALRPGTSVYHAATPELRAEVERRLAQDAAPVTASVSKIATLRAERGPRPVAIVYCERLENESFCESVVRELGAYYEVRPCGPGWPTENLLDADHEGARFYLELDAASGNFVRPVGLSTLSLPKFAWLIDVHKKTSFHQSIAGDVDLCFYAMQSWGHVLPGKKAWLPVHADSNIFFPREEHRDLDLVFVGSQPWRADPLRRIAERHGLRLHVSRTTGPHEKTETAALYARAKLVFNRHVTNDLNFRVVEAMSCGRVVLTDAQLNGQYELFEDGRHYVLYKDEADLEQRVLEYLADECARTRVEEEAATWSRAHHSTQTRVRQLRDAIEEHIGSGAAPSVEPGPEMRPRPIVRPPAEPVQRWLFVVGAEPATVALKTYAETLAWELSARGHEVVVARAQRLQLPPPDHAPGEPQVLELDTGPLPRAASASSRTLSSSGPLLARLTQELSNEPPFDAVVGEGAFGALVASPLAEQIGAPFFLALDGCEVARRGNKLSREQLYWAELEHWATDRAQAVLAPFEDVVEHVRQFYKAKDVQWLTPVLELQRPQAAERLLVALGIQAPFVLVLASELQEVEQQRILGGEFPEGIRSVALASPSGLYLRTRGHLERLSRLPCVGPTLAALLIAAKDVIALESVDMRILEAGALGVRVSVTRTPEASSTDSLRELLNSARPVSAPAQVASPRLEDLVGKPACARERELASALL